MKPEKFNDIKNNLEHYCTYYTLAEISNLCNVSSTIINNHIKKQTGKTYGTYRKILITEYIRESLNKYENEESLKNEFKAIKKQLNISRATLNKYLKTFGYNFQHGGQRYHDWEKNYYKKIGVNMNSSIIKIATASTKKNEGHRSKVYLDSEGIQTIGWGFTIRDLELSKAVSDIIIDEKIEKIVYVLSTDERFKFLNSCPSMVSSVVIEMCYQLGVDGFLKFKRTIRALSVGNYKEAALEMVNSKWYSQTPERAKQLSDIIHNITEFDNDRPQIIT